MKKFRLHVRKIHKFSVTIEAPSLEKAMENITTDSIPWKKVTMHDYPEYSIIKVEPAGKEDCLTCCGFGQIEGFLGVLDPCPKCFPEE